MNVSVINKCLSDGNLEEQGLFPHLEELANQQYIFTPEFGLSSLPREPGVIIIRGARQYGKSTWLERELKNTVEDFGPGSAFYLNGDEIKNSDHLSSAIMELIPLLSVKAEVKRLFIDEITAIKDWEKSIKRLADAGDIKNILLITTGSSAGDLRRGSERLPGRVGKLDRHTYIFLPVSYKEFKRVCGDDLKNKTFISYLISGGSPIACNELASKNRIPEYVITMAKDWIYGEFYRAKHNRDSLLAIMDALFKFGGTPLGQAKLARESGLANNTVAANNLEILRDNLCMMPSYCWDSQKDILVSRKPAKFHFINMLVALSWYKTRVRTVEDFCNLTDEEQGKFYEWFVAQEIWRREQINQAELIDHSLYWQSKDHEIDFVTSDRQFFEVKKGSSSVMDFSWFPKVFQHKKLNVINQKSFLAESIVGVTFEDWLLE